VRAQANPIKESIKDFEQSLENLRPSTRRVYVAGARTAITAARLELWQCLSPIELLASIGKSPGDKTLRRQLSTHQVVTVRLPTADHRVLTIRPDTRAEKIHTEIYRSYMCPNASCRRLIGGPKIVTKPVREPASNQHPIFKTRKSGY
jgi:hypothetical protein